MNGSTSRDCSNFRRMGGPASRFFSVTLPASTPRCVKRNPLLLYSGSHEEWRTSIYCGFKFPSDMRFVNVALTLSSFVLLALRTPFCCIAFGLFRRVGRYGHTTKKRCSGALNTSTATRGATSRGSFRDDRKMLSRTTGE